MSKQTFILARLANNKFAILCKKSPDHSYMTQYLKLTFKSDIEAIRYAYENEITLSQ